MPQDVNLRYVRTECTVMDRILSRAEIDFPRFGRETATTAWADLLIAANPQVDFASMPLLCVRPTAKRRTCLK